MTRRRRLLRAAGAPFRALGRGLARTGRVLADLAGDVLEAVLDG